MRRDLAVAAVVVIGSLAVVFANRGDRWSDDHTVSAQGPVKGWAAVADIPGGPAYTDAIVWTGSELVVFGGDRDSGREVDPTNVGARYDPRVGKWRELPSPPAKDLYNPQAVWTGREVIVVGVTCSEDREGHSSAVPDCSPGDLVAMSYDPASDEWSMLAAVLEPPARARDGEAHGAYSVGWNGEAAIFRIDGNLWGYDVSRATWHRLPDAPLMPASDLWCANGETRSVTIGALSPPNDALDGSGQLSDGKYEQDRGPRVQTALRQAPWSSTITVDAGTVTEQRGLLVEDVLAAGCAGPNVVVFRGPLNAARATRFDVPALRWLPMATPPPIQAIFRPPMFETAERIIVLGDVSLASYDIETDTWTSVPNPYGAAPTRAILADDIIVAQVVTADDRLTYRTWTMPA